MTMNALDTQLSGLTPNRTVNASDQNYFQFNGSRRIHRHGQYFRKFP
jgi:hypothetical protein